MIKYVVFHRFVVCFEWGFEEMSVKDSVVSMVKTPLGAVLILVITLILSGLSIASAISGELTAAATSAAGLVVIVLIIAMINIIGK